MSNSRGPTHYEVLGLTVAATDLDVRRAYRDRAKQVHPDAGGDAATFRRLLDAYETLIHADRRQIYDESLGATVTAVQVDTPPGPWQPAGDFTGEVEFPGWMRATTDAVWAAAEQRAEGAGAAEAGPAAEPPADVVWWTTEQVSASPTAAGLLFVVPTATAIEGRSFERGEVAWRAPLGRQPIGCALVVGNLAVAVDDLGTVHGVDLGNGITRVTVLVGVPVPAGPGTDGTTVVVPEVAATVAAVDLAGRRVAWRARLLSAAAHPPAFADGATVLATARSVEAIDLRTGHHRWRVELPRPLDLPPVVAAGGIWLAGAAGPGMITRLDVATGASRGTITAGRAVAGLAGDDDRLFVTAAHPNQLLAVDDHGRTAWTVPLEAVGPEPGRFGDVLYLADPSGTLRVIDRHTGAVLQRRSVPFEPVGAPRLAVDRIVLPARDGHLWGIIRPAPPGHGAVFPGP